jgi:hypothetical protein
MTGIALSFHGFLLAAVLGSFAMRPAELKTALKRALQEAPLFAKVLIALPLSIAVAFGRVAIVLIGAALFTAALMTCLAAFHSTPRRSPRQEPTPEQPQEQVARARTWGTRSLAELDPNGVLKRGGKWRPGFGM